MQRAKPKRSRPKRFYGQFWFSSTCMSYKGFDISTRQHLPGHWHAHVVRDGVEFSTLPNDRRFEWEAYRDGERKVDELINSASSIDGDMGEVWQHSTEV